jgi:polyphenol oxidase
VGPCTFPDKINDMVRSLEVVRAPGWEQYGWLIHGFSTRTGGVTKVYRPDGSDLNLGFTASDDRDLVTENRRRFVEAAADGKALNGLVTIRQIHSDRVQTVSMSDIAAAQCEGDGLMTGEPGVLLGIQTADCIPVLVADTKNRAVAAFHAGWRGTVARIVEKGIGRMNQKFGSRPEDLIASIGPGIGSCCYTVGDEVHEKFHAQFAYAGELFRGMQLDLPEANRRQLLAAELGESKIFSTGLCTGCATDRFFSHRMEQGFTGRMMSVIGIAGGK